MLKRFFLLFLLLIGCGYKPSTTYTKKILKDNIKIDFQISPKNPKETIYLKDALIDSVYTIFNSNINNNNPDTILTVTLLSFNISPIDYDNNGFPILYRSKVNLKVKINSKPFLVNGQYDFAVSANSVINEQLKLDAFKKAAINALNNLLTKLTINGAKK
jgi:hypothetical protein